MHAARWEEAIALLSQLRGLTGIYPDVEALIADAQLKLEIEQAGVSAAAPPPKPHPPRAAIFGGMVAITLISLIVVAVLFVRLDASGVSVAAQPLMLNLTFPTIAPTRTPTPAPTTTPQLQSQTAPPTVDIPGILGVRLAPGASTNRTIENLAVILDASGSMLARIDGTPKTVIARQTLITLVNRLPDTTNVALRTYGHRRADDCSDTELIQPLGPLQRDDLIARINAVRPVNGGRTPIAQSLADMAQDLADIEGDVLIVLVSDGDETCGGDPVATTSMLRAANPRLRVSVIGFDVEQEEWRHRLVGIAAAGGGAYFDAANAEQLADVLDQAIALTYRIFDSQGIEVYQGRIGSTVRLTPGAYRVEIGGDTELMLDTVRVESNATTFVELHEEQGMLRFSTVTDEGPQP